MSVLSASLKLKLKDTFPFYFTARWIKDVTKSYTKTTAISKQSSAIKNCGLVKLETLFPPPSNPPGRSVGLFVSDYNKRSTQIKDLQAPTHLHHFQRTDSGNVKSPSETRYNTPTHPHTRMGITHAPMSTIVKLITAVWV